MTILRNKVSFFLGILAILCLGCNSKSFFKIDGLNTSLNYAIEEILKIEPECKFITVFFTESKDKTYMFVQSENSIHNLTSSYYSNNTNHSVIIVYENKVLESRFSDFKSKKESKLFSEKGEFDFYENKTFVFEITPGFEITRLDKYDENLRKLNGMNRVDFIEPNN